MQREVIEFNTVLNCYIICNHAFLLMWRGSRCSIHAVRLMRAFRFISDEKVKHIESMIKKI
jgi:hypothetical protein